MWPFENGASRELIPVAIRLLLTLPLLKWIRLLKHKGRGGEEMILLREEESHFPFQEPNYSV